MLLFPSFRASNSENCRINTSIKRMKKNMALSALPFDPTFFAEPVRNINALAYYGLALP